MMQKIIFYFAGAVVIFSVSSCMTKKPQRQKEVLHVVGIGEEYILSDSELARTKIMAIKGDNEAAWKVAHYYGDIKKDTFSAVGWLLLAANNGYVDAQTLLGSMHQKDDILENLELQKYWLKRAAKNGSKGAKMDLERLEKSRQNIGEENEKGSEKLKTKTKNRVGPS